MSSTLWACLAALVVAAPFLYIWFGKPPASFGDHDYDSELRTWKALSAQGERVEGVVHQLTRHPMRLTKAGSYGNNEVGAVDLVLSYADAQGAEHRVSVSTFIDLVLIANFSEGRTVALLRDPRDPQRVAIDRERNPTEIPPTSR